MYIELIGITVMVFISYRYTQHITSFTSTGFGKKTIALYYIGGHEYARVCKINRNPSDILFIIDEDGIDVTTDVLRYYGPEKSVKGLGLTPDDLGYKKLIFTKQLDDECTIFEQFDILT